MDNTSPNQDDLTRHVTKKTLESLNLKVTNNLNEYMILIVGIHDYHNLLENLSMTIREEHVQVFNDIDPSLQFINSQDDTNIFLIISGTLGNMYAHKFDGIVQIIGIYVYCMNVNKHTIWTKQIQKIRCIVSNTTQLLTRLHADIKELSGRWPLGEKSFQKASTITSEWYHLFLLVISYRPQCLKKSYCEMFDECRAYYKNHPSMLPEIDTFEQTYQSDNAIREYTRNSFLYRITNHALRTQNMKIIKNFSPFISDLHYQIHESHRKYYRSNIYPIHCVYRGQLLSIDELEYLRSVCKSRNPIIKLTTFGSASLDPEIAMAFASSSDDHIPCLFEILITAEYNIEQSHAFDHTQAFANISSLSVLSSEQEVLFSLLTHFRIKYVSDSIVHPYYPWIVIVLELVTDRKRESDYSHFYVIKRIEQEKNLEHYNDILNFLEVNTEDEVKFNKMNWKKWWSNLTKHWGTDKAGEQSLPLIFYQCFTEDKYWSRKSIEMYKDILHFIPEIQSLASDFLTLFKKFKVLQAIPSKWIALYEDYVEQFCITNTKEVINCLYFAGETYEMVSDKERALECYQKGITLNGNDQHQMNRKIQNRLRKLEKPDKTTQTIKSDRKAAPTNDFDESFQRMYQTQQEQWSSFWDVRRDAVQIRSKLMYLQVLRTYLIQREQWYDASDSKIILRLPYQNTQNLSIQDYQSNLLPVIRQHILSTAKITDCSNNRFLTLWRYDKYMREWALLKQLEMFLKPLQEKLSDTLSVILPQLEQLIKKISLLIIVCTVYICIEPENGKINVNNIQFINFTNTNINQLVFFDLRDNDLLNGLKALHQQTSTRTVSPINDLNPFEYLNLS